MIQAALEAHTHDATRGVGHPPDQHRLVSRRVGANPDRRGPVQVVGGHQQRGPDVPRPGVGADVGGPAAAQPAGADAGRVGPCARRLGAQRPLLPQRAALPPVRRGRAPRPRWGRPRPWGSSAKAFDRTAPPGTWAELRQVSLAGSSLRNWVLTYDAIVQEQADFALPPGYAGTPITLYLQWLTTATSGATWSGRSPGW